jgi:RimJ/RimL family protein N-acetyltransferase
MSMYLETERLVLRRPEPRDAAAVIRYFGTDRSAGNGGPLPSGLAWRAFAAQLGHWQIHGFGMWTATRRDENRALGMVGPWTPIDWPENEIGWMIFDDANEGTGLAFEAARAALDHAFSALGWNTAVSYINEHNTRSIRLAERLGAVLDPDATLPPVDWPPLVYRHPTPGEDA